MPFRRLGRQQGIQDVAAQRPEASRQYLRPSPPGIPELLHPPHQCLAQQQPLEHPRRPDPPLPPSRALALGQLQRTHRLTGRRHLLPARLHPGLRLPPTKTPSAATCTYYQRPPACGEDWGEWGCTGASPQASRSSGRRCVDTGLPAVASGDSVRGAKGQRGPRRLVSSALLRDGLCSPSPPIVPRLAVSHVPAGVHPGSSDRVPHTWTRP